MKCFNIYRKLETGPPSETNCNGSSPSTGAKHSTKSVSNGRQASPFSWPSLANSTCLRSPIRRMRPWITSRIDLLPDGRRCSPSPVPAPSHQSC